jgi:hypothetical protein
MSNLDLGSIDLDSVEPLRTVRPDDIADVPHDQRWLVEGVWPAAGVGVIAATPKIGKTWLAADLAMSVATSTPFLKHFPVMISGPVLMFASEDQNHEMKDRLRGLAGQRGLSLSDLAFGLVDEPSLRLNHPKDLARFERRIRDDRPVLVVLDPLRRIFSGNESSSDAISAVLGQLRRIQRQYHVAIVLTHHLSKQSEHKAVSGDRMRGSGDLHAWGDVNLYAWRSKLDENVAIVKVEHRNAVRRRPFTVRRVVEELAAGGTTAHLEYVGEIAEGTDPTAKKPDALRTRVLAKLTEGAIGSTELRVALGVNAGALSDMFKTLEGEGLIKKNLRKWHLASGPSSA